MSSSPRSVKISDDERGGWSSERPRRPGEPERPARPMDVSVRGRVLAPADHMRYSPGSLVLVVCPDPELRDAFCERVLADQNALLSLEKVRALIKGRVDDAQLDAKAQELVDATAAKRLAAGHSVVVALESLGADEREHYVRMAAPHRRPRHLVLVEVGKDRVPDEIRDVLAELRTRLDGGELGQEGFATSMRLGGNAVRELKRIVFAPPPRDD
ncbi:MAG TPA: hypothetical protein VD836_00690 [Solirubrobacteraceae bacterium]|jgi:hypothetical protein|nr:hypothetical protein [Solirubrobacteraceae bacterium]